MLVKGLSLLISKLSGYYTDHVKFFSLTLSFPYTHITAFPHCHLRLVLVVRLATEVEVELFLKTPPLPVIPLFPSISTIKQLNTLPSPAMSTKALTHGKQQIP